MQSLATLVTRQAHERGGKVALRFGNEAITFAELERRASQVANGLAALGVRAGDRVAYLGKNSTSYFEALLGAAKAGAVMVPINWRLAPPEIAALVLDCEPRWLLLGAGFEASRASLGATVPHVEHVAAESFARWRDAQSDAASKVTGAADDAVLQLYTSGTTGRPKGSVLTNQSLFSLRAAMSQPEWYRWSPEDVSLIAMPVAHISGTGWGIWSLMHGASGIVTEEFDPHAVLDLLIEHRINKLMLVPTAIQIALRHPRAREADFSSLRYIYYGGSPMPASLLREAMAVFGCGFVQMYGMTETAGTIVALPPEDHDPAQPERLGSVGVPLPGVELQIRDAAGRELTQGETGEIVTRSVANMAGYYRQPEATSATLDQDGWLRTGDAGFLDAHGYLHLRDRVKDLIISGGENVYPGEVENAVRGHPCVADVAVIGVPDEKWGEKVVAVVVAKADVQPDALGIIEWTRARIAKYKCPKAVEFVSALPRTASGKVLRRELRELFR
jgi:acyl-CoA synthetase (AMP-forming)/AMP-acid ligase II